jgi:sulfatase maturation enzyme AslB (radical SAM superfamily)
MTATAASLSRVEEIIDQYVKLGFCGIFLRSLSPYGFAAKSLVSKYDAGAWIEFYRRALAHILEINRRGTSFREEYTSVLMRKIASPEGTSYVDLQSPAGIGIGAVVYNYDGWLYGSDEGRMLAEMGDMSFRLGHLDRDSYEATMTSDTLIGALADTMLEGVPMCSDCAFLPYCGADPVRHKATQGDKAFSEFCAKQMGVLRHLLGLLDGNAFARETLLSWA